MKVLDLQTYESIKYDLTKSNIEMSISIIALDDGRVLVGDYGSSNLSILG